MPPRWSSRRDGVGRSLAAGHRAGPGSQRARTSDLAPAGRVLASAVGLAAKPASRHPVLLELGLQKAAFVVGAMPALPASSAFAAPLTL